MRSKNNNSVPRFLSQTKTEARVPSGKTFGSRSIQVNVNNFHFLIICGQICETDDDKFSINAVAHCTSMVKSPFQNHYTLDAAGGNTLLMCRVLAQHIGGSQAYSVSAELLNQAGYKGRGHPGILFNAVDENNFDFVYFR